MYSYVLVQCSTLRIDTLKVNSKVESGPKELH